MRILAAMESLITSQLMFLGLNLFISSFRFNKPMIDVYRAVLPFIGILLFSLLLVTYVPWLSTYLPSLSKTQDLTQEELGLPPTPTTSEGTEGDPGVEPPSDEGETLEDLDNLTLDDLDLGEPSEPVPEPAGDDDASPPGEPAEDPE
jgi:hypothetical protein